MRRHFAAFMPRKSLDRLGLFRGIAGPLHHDLHPHIAVPGGPLMALPAQGRYLPHGLLLGMAFQGRQIDALRQRFACEFPQHSLPHGYLIACVRRQPLYLEQSLALCPSTPRLRNSIRLGHMCDAVPDEAYSLPILKQGDHSLRSYGLQPHSQPQPKAQQRQPYLPCIFHMYPCLILSCSPRASSASAPP